MWAHRSLKLQSLTCDSHTEVQVLITHHVAIRGQRTHMQSYCSLSKRTHLCMHTIAPMHSAIKHTQTHSTGAPDIKAGTAESTDSVINLMSEVLNSPAGPREAGRIPSMSNGKEKEQSPLSPWRERTHRLWLNKCCIYVNVKPVSNYNVVQTPHSTSAFHRITQLANSSQTDSWHVVSS